MLSERAKINYAKAVLRRQYSGDPLTGGALVAGKYYQISSFVSGDDFTNVGALLDSIGFFVLQVFRATGTNPTNWTHGSRLVEIKLDDLKNYSLQVFPGATSPVTLTSTGFEGGAQSGEVTFDKSLLGVAIEELIAEFDPDYIEPTPVARRALGTVVRLGY